MSEIVEILNFEEGYVESPYLDTLGFPTVAGGIRIGPKGASLANYTFTVPRSVGDVWKRCMIDTKTASMNRQSVIAAALAKCNDARRDILISMAYQLGVNGLAKFKKSLALVAAGNFAGASVEMLDSDWARQTPNRAHRHAEVMRTGTYAAYKGVI
ncbi:glycoside hydrolase family protein [Pantoea vagans]|uniref:glycoside hydrolase family protein n=1 Tax=Pantoea vagans TaxID=470934 RepID=UPI00241F24DA|nr:glycoside hydrolase family protein [Pantoea vagans]